MTRSDAENLSGLLIECLEDPPTKTTINSQDQAE